MIWLIFRFKSYNALNNHDKTIELVDNSIKLNFSGKEWIIIGLYPNYGN